MLWRYPTRTLAAAALAAAVLAPGHARLADGAAAATGGTSTKAHEIRLHDAWLAAAAGNVRVIEPRLTGGFAYGGVRTPAAPVATSSQLYAAAARMQAIATADPKADHLRALGVAYLLIGSADEARDALERARAAAPDDPRVLSDLSAALLAQSGAADDTWDAVRALNHAERAWRLAPAMPEAAFNTALARERLHLRSEARKAWLAARQLQPGSPWAAEAAAHDTALSAEVPGLAWPRTRTDLTARIGASASSDTLDADGLARRFPQAIREYLQEELLPSWAAASLSGDAASAARRIDAASALCAALAAHGDGSCRNGLDRIRAASPSSLSTLAAAYRDYGLAMAVYRENRFAESQTLLARARDAFVRGGSPEARWCEVYLSVIDIWGGQPARAAERLRVQLRDAHPDDFAYRGRIGWLLGLYDVTREDFGSALAHYEEGNRAFDRAREAENRARLDLLMAEVLAKMGTRREAWQRYHRALAGLTEVRGVAARHAILGGASFASLEEEMPSAALAFQNELLTGNPALSEPVAVTEGYLHRFEALARLGDTEASRSLQRARQTLAAVRDPSLNRRLEAEITLREGRVSSASQPRQAIDLLTRSLELFQGGSFLDRLPEVFQARGQARLLARDETAAQGDFLAGLAAVEARAGSLQDEARRASALEPAWPLAASLISLRLSQDRPLDALAQAERAKNGSLSRDATIACGSDPQCWTRVVSPDTSVLYYAQLADHLAVWVITSASVDSFVLPVPSAELRARVNQYRRALEQRQPDAQLLALSSALYDQILLPVHARIRDRATLVIVPDDSLHGVPFAALYDSRRRRYAIEDHTIVVSPTFTQFAGHATSDRHIDWRAARDLRAIVVTNPKTTGLISAQLPPLPGADAEAAHMAGLFADVRILRDADATHARLRAALAGGQILHVASHARVNYRSPWRSYFVLAPDGGRPGEELLFMSDLSSLPLRGLRLAVLAACGSADGPVALGGASLSLARPFLSAGVPNVIASLWPVSDRASRALFTDFYSHVVQGVAPAMALRDAQLAMLRNADAGLQSPTFWAPFVAIGGMNTGTNASGAATASLSTRSTLRTTLERGAR